ncbi:MULTISPECIES: SHOCT domain-containing protein [unclassified Haladaptatus]|uniref:SHOCT domain-containing protein n=1 Tax=unclassified Haladaptatus TaxID=2622732 RepID=UPI0023E78881|nr:MULTISPECIES: SHOCT domain-containing protein [unclassified Haladaptatus]
MTTSTTDRRVGSIVLVILGALLLFPILFVGFGMMGFGSMMGGFWGGGFGMGSGAIPGWMLAVAFVGQLLFLAAIVAGGYLLVRSISNSGTDSALDELRLAYARGDLTDEEYETRKHRLEADSR